ncbi:gamma-tubulin complex component 4, putative [Eimeria tenella]|uniref:Gamma-tubulin complex component 4, putative n=1 Tax=Eimeria tenella TaxID=5802 RepID=U6KTK5_EIMTE|nr:gamma-tubulin complex component 4, putative [Eimeria tenella]CDJ39714.1 gamma-tubulin complex component 4, putative [Eimeria tenella]|eukprot:XP_013230467.1 gamma-tubulin complex component 4, putative [Eimeria tenella]
MCALKQGAPHAQLGALALPLDFNDFLSQLTLGGPPTPRGAPYRGPPSPRGSARGSLESAQQQQQQQQQRLVTAEAAGAPTAAAAAILGAPRSLTPRGPRHGTDWGAPEGPRGPPRSASVGAPIPRERAASGAPIGAPQEDNLLLHSCRSTDSAEEAPSELLRQGGPPSYLTQGGLGAPGGPLGGPTGGPPGGRWSISWNHFALLLTACLFALQQMGLYYFISRYSLSLLSLAAVDLVLLLLLLQSSSSELLTRPQLSLQGPPRGPQQGPPKGTQGGPPKCTQQGPPGVLQQGPPRDAQQGAPVGPKQGPLGGP